MDESQKSFNRPAYALGFHMLVTVFLYNTKNKKEAGEIL